MGTNKEQMPADHPEAIPGLMLPGTGESILSSTPDELTFTAEMSRYMRSMIEVYVAPFYTTAPTDGIEPERARFWRSGPPPVITKRSVHRFQGPAPPGHHHSYQATWRLAGAKRDNYPDWPRRKDDLSRSNTRRIIKMQEEGIQLNYELSRIDLYNSLTALNTRGANNLLKHNNQDILRRTTIHILGPEDYLLNAINHDYRQKGPLEHRVHFEPDCVATTAQEDTTILRINTNAATVYEHNRYAELLQYRPDEVNQSLTRVVTSEYERPDNDFLLHEPALDRRQLASLITALMSGHQFDTMTL